MSNKIRLLYGLYLLCNCAIIAQVSSTVDTIFQVGLGNTIQLSNSFILESSVKVDYLGESLTIESIQSIEGIITLSDSKYDFPIVVHYDYLNKGLPISVGPKWKTLPALGTKISQLNQEISSYAKPKSNTESNLFSSGNIYRQLTISPLGGSDFTGGLQMQLNGKLTENLIVSGVLTDQELTIQPEGTTRELEEIDLVYLKVTHPNYTVDAGDIFFENNLNKKQKIDRKLIGLKNSFNINNWTGAGVFANSKGNFKSMEFKGRDADQGPYQLTGKDGNRDIIILSGTEKVWVNGKNCIRGQNQDYIIDYSSGEIQFTPKTLIHSDSDIFVEYQYSNFEYQKEFIGGSMKKVFAHKGLFSYGYFRESDEFNGMNWRGDIKDSLNVLDAGKIKISTAVLNDKGDYIKNNNIFEYYPENISSDSLRYTVTFEYNENGKYARKISNKGRIYYKYITGDISQESDQDRYSPFRLIYAPQTHSLGYFGGEYKIGNNLKISSNLTTSMVNRNSYNLSGNTSNGSASMVEIILDSLEFSRGLFYLSISDWTRGLNYYALGQENDVQQRRFWNLDSSLNNNIKESKVNSTLIIHEYGTTNIEIAQLNHQNFTHSRFFFNQDITHLKFTNTYINHRSIRKPKGIFNRSDGRFQIHFKEFSPFIKVLSETESNVARFRNVGSGIQFQNLKTHIETGVDLRKDETFNDSTTWESISEDFIGFIDMKAQFPSGWSQNIIYKKRIKSFESSLPSLDYSLATLAFSYNRGLHPLQWELQINKEESLSEERAVVYDSVGTGLGQYRYDPVFNTYVSDPNGAFIAHSISTGKRDPTSNFEGSQRFMFDFGKIPGLPKLLIRSHSRLDYSALKSDINKILRPEITDSTISRSRLESRLEIIYSGKRRLLSWIENQHELNGLDPRGNDLHKTSSFGLDIEQSISNILQVKLNTKHRTKIIKSTVSDLRNRKMAGWWNETRFHVSINSSFDFDIGFLTGFDSGEQQENSFTGHALGYLVNGRFFFKKTGRLQTSMSWINAFEKNYGYKLPPEALNGYPLGKSFRSNTRLQYFINRSISMIFTLDTINDIRYKNFITFQGEIRAHF